MRTRSLHILNLLTYFGVIVLFVFSIWVRFHDLSGTPPGLLVDEAAEGYNAYLLLKTGKDEWGAHLPLTFRSFEDYKPPGYIYTLVPFIRVFGLSTSTIRLPSAIAGIISIFAIFLISQGLTKNRFIAIGSSLILATSPWHISIHRLGLEWGLGMTLFLIGTAFYVSKIRLRFFFSALFYSLSIYTSLSYRALVPLIILAFCIFLAKKRLFRVAFIFFISFLIFSLPLLKETFYHGSGNRLSQVATGRFSSATMTIQEAREFCAFQKSVFINYACRLIWNKPLYLLEDFAKSYFKHFYPSFLFYPGDTSNFLNNVRYGGLYFWLIPFFVLGLFSLNLLPRDSRRVLVSLLLISPIGSFLGGQPSYSRGSAMLLPIVIITSLGFYGLVSNLRRKTPIIPTIISLFFILITLYSFLGMSLDYFFVYSKSINVWEEEYKSLYPYLSQIENGYDRMIIKRMHDNPYIYYAFFTAYDPKKFLETAVRDNDEVVKIGKYQFKSTNMTKTYCEWLSSSKPKTLYIGNDDQALGTALYSIKSYNQVYTFISVYDLAQVDISVKQNHKIINCLDVQ